MAKKNFNMGEPKKGLDLLIPTTTNQVGSSEETTTGGKKKQVHSNFVMDPRYHKQMKIIATNKGVSLKVALEEALSAYCEKNKDFL